MATVHTEYGPGRIVASETIRGCTRFKVAGEGFEVWLDETKLGAYERPDHVDFDAPHWQGHHPDDTTVYPEPHAPLSDDEYAEYADPRGHFDRDRLRTHPDYLDDGDMDSRFARRRQAFGPGEWDHVDGHDDPYADKDFDDLGDLRRRLQPVDRDEDDPARYSSRGTLGKGEAHLAWAPMDRDNSTELPYNPDPQHDAIGTPGDDNSSTLQPIHHIDADERTRSADSLSFEGEGDGDEPGPNPDLFAKQAFDLSVVMNHPEVRRKMLEVLPEDKRDVAERGWGGLQGHGVGAAAGYGMNFAKGQIDNALDAAIGTGTGWGPLQASHRPAGLSDRYIDITAAADYHNDPVAQFRHDPDAYINRVGHLMDEGLNPRFAEYMDLVEADSGIRTAAWKDVRAKAMRLKTSGAVHVKDIAPSRIMASVDGDHGTYDVTILKGASYGDQSIANWHCGCEWGRWAFKRKFTYVGRLCSHAYASYLTMQSASLAGQPRGTRPSRGPADTVVVKRKQKDRFLPTFQMAAGRRTADALQNGPDRLTPELCVNDTDDAHMFMDVTKDERDDTGPDDVMSDTDIVHFARLMRHCEVTQQPYPRQLVAFLSRYSGCADDATDDTQADYQAHDADDANEYLTKLRNDADGKQEDDFGSMAERVRRIQDTVDEAREHGADASQFVASVRTAEPKFPGVDTSDDGPFNPGKWPGYVDQASDWAVNKAKGVGKAVSDAGSNALKTVRELDTSDNGPFNPGNWFRTDGDDSKKGDDGKKDDDSKTTDPSGMSKDTQRSVLEDALGGFNTDGNPYAPGANGQANNGQANNGQANNGQANNGQANNGQATLVSDQSAGDAAGAADGGGWKSPPGGTKGTVTDGGVAGAENGDNSAITKNMLDAEGYYTLKPGETLTDLAQRGYGDMNKYEDLAKANNITNADDLSGVTKVKFDADKVTGNGGLSGDVTNPAGGGADSNPATVDTPTGAATVNATDATQATALGTNAGTSIGLQPVETGAAADPGSTTPKPPGGQVAQDAVPPPAAPEAPKAPEPTAQPKPTAGSTAEGSLRTARDWLRWAAEGDGSGTDGTADAAADASQPSPTAETPGSGDRQTPGTNPASPTSSGTRTTTPGGADDFGPSIEETYDPTDPMQVSQQQNSFANPSAQAGSGSPQGRSDSLNMFSNPSGADIGNLIGQGASVAGDIASSAMSALPGLSGVASGIGNAVSGIASGLGSIFSSKQDFDEWVRYAYPAGGGDDFDPDTLPHIPFAGSGNPGPLEFSTSEEYADKARKKMDDVTDLGDGDLTTPMGDWQKQGSVEDEDDGPYREASIGYSTDDDSDIVRTFQAHLGETALGAGAGGGGGRFDDFSGAAQGFLRTAGRNYSLAEQDELVREGDRGGARNLASLDLKGTHYEDMNTLGW